MNLEAVLVFSLGRFFFLYMIGENIEHELLQGLDATEGKSHKHCEIQGLIESIFKQNSAQHS